MSLREEYGVTSPSNLPRLDELSNTSETLRMEMAEMGKRNLYYLCKVILGYRDLTPEVHGPMCAFSDKTRGKAKRRMKLMPRTHFKTTVWTIAETIQDIVINPNVRILVVSNTGRNAELFMEEMQQHFELNEVFRWVYREIVPENFNTTRWNKNELLVKRDLIAREPTIDAIGAFGGIESRHYDKIKADDLVVEKHIYSDVEMDKLIQWANGLDSLLISQIEGTIDWVGSRKKKGDLYEVVQKNYGWDEEPKPIGPHATIMGELAIFSRHVKEKGNIIFPQMITQKFLDRLKRADPQRYHAQYANDPKGSGLNTFSRDWFRFAKWEGNQIVCRHDGEELGRFSPFTMDRIIVYDPSVAEKKSSSKQAINVLAKGDGPFRFVLESYVDHIDPLTAVELLFDLQEKWKCSLVSIEKRGFQGWVQYHLDSVAEQKNLPYLPVVSWPPQGSPSAQWAKTEHIRGLQPIVRSGWLWLFEDQEELIEELEYYPNVRWDDGLDSLAQMLDYWPYMEDDSTVRARRVDERNFLEQVALGNEGMLESLDVWNEAEFLSQFDVTGYGFREA